MKLIEMLNALRIQANVEVRDEENVELFTCNTQSEVLRNYLNWEVVEWFVGCAPFKTADFTILVRHAEVRDECDHCIYKMEADNDE